MTVNSAVVAGTGFSLSAGTLPVSLSSGQSLTLNILFDPTTAGAATGTLIISSTSSTGATVTIALSGTGVSATAYQVNLTWSAPASSSDPVAGYNVYRSVSGASAYQQVNTTVIAQTYYVDTSMQSGTSYDYMVESVDASGVASDPSNTVTLAIP